MYSKQFYQAEPPWDRWMWVVSYSQILPTIKEPLALTEIWEVISKLKGIKAVGICDFHAELPWLLSGSQRSPLPGRGKGYYSAQYSRQGACSSPPDMYQIYHLLRQ